MSRLWLMLVFLLAACGGTKLTKATLEGISAPSGTVNGVTGPTNAVLPTVSLSVVAPEFVRGALPVTVSVTQEQVVTSVIVRADGADVATASAAAAGQFAASVDSTLLLDGARSLVAVAKMATGEVVSAAVSITVDNTAPAAGFTFPAALSALQPSAVSLSLDASDATSGLAEVRFRQQGSATTLCTVTQAPFSCSSLGALSDGVITYEGVVQDRAGNTTTASVTLSVDGTAPSGSFTSPATGAVVNPSLSPIVVSTADGMGAVASVQIRRGATVVCTDTTAPYACVDAQPGLSEGNVVYDATVTDTAGNTTSFMATVIVDLTPPQLVSVSGPAGAGLPWSSAPVLGVAKFPRFYFRVNEPLDPLSSVEVCANAADCATPEPSLAFGLVSSAVGPSTTDDTAYFAVDRLSDELAQYVLDVRGLRDRAGNPLELTGSTNGGLFTFSVAEDRRGISLSCAGATSDDGLRAVFLSTIGGANTPCTADLSAVVANSPAPSLLQSVIFYNGGGSSSCCNPISVLPTSSQASGFAFNTGARRQARATLTVDAADLTLQQDFAYVTATDAMNDASPPTLTGSYISAHSEVFAVLAFNERLNPLSLASATASIAPGGTPVRLDVDPVFGLIYVQSLVALQPAEYSLEVSGLTDTAGVAAPSISLAFLVPPAFGSPVTILAVDPPDTSTDLPTRPTFDVAASAAVSPAGAADGVGFRLFELVGVEQQPVPVRGFTASKVDAAAHPLQRVPGARIFYEPHEVQPLPDGVALRLDLALPRDNGPTMATQSFSYAVGTAGQHRPTLRDLRVRLTQSDGASIGLSARGVASDEDECPFGGSVTASIGGSSAPLGTSVAATCKAVFDVTLSQTDLLFSPGENPLDFTVQDTTSKAATIRRNAYVFHSAPSIVAPVDASTNVSLTPTIEATLPKVNGQEALALLAFNNVLFSAGNKTRYFAFSSWGGNGSSLTLQADDALPASTTLGVNVGVLGFAEPESGFSLLLSPDNSFTTVP